TARATSVIRFFGRGFLAKKIHVCAVGDRPATESAIKFQFSRATPSVSFQCLHLDVPSRVDCLSTHTFLRSLLVMKFAVFALVGLALVASVAYAADPVDPEANCPEVECGEYEEYKCCGSCFQESCITKKMKCQTKCTKGCFCQEGFIREFDGGKCMPRKLCPALQKKGR
uniref:Uncharacterized protein n=2 Tax=Anopheles atroparvus TaxID=41427 RepID=A0A182JJM1_ANOAO